MSPIPLAGLRPLALTVLLATGCATPRAPAAPPAAPAASLEAPVQLGIAELVVLNEVAVRFDRVLEDSRCPADVQCVRAGEARVRLLVNETPVDLAVRPGDSDWPTAVDAHGLHIEVLGLTPAPGTPEARADEPVEVELAITAASGAGTAGRTDR